MSSGAKLGWDKSELHLVCKLGQFDPIEQKSLSTLTLGHLDLPFT